MKTLYLLRHAKSSWDNPSLTDFERPLNERGSKAAPFMGGLMRDLGFLPYIILSSPAVRAKTTAQMVKAAGPLDAEIRYERRIYEASPQRLREVVAEIDNAHPSLLIVGHNPGIEGFIRYLTGDLESIPTAALGVISLDIDNWYAIGEGRGDLQKVYRPKDEMKYLRES